jgi:hypothetical protein
MYTATSWWYQIESSAGGIFNVFQDTRVETVSPFCDCHVRATLPLAAAAREPLNKFSPSILLISCSTFVDGLHLGTPMKGTDN